MASKQTGTVTVFYYEQQQMAELKSCVFSGLKTGKGGRCVLPDAFREQNLILLVVEGEAKIQSRLGDRFFDSELGRFRDSAA